MVTVDKENILRQMFLAAIAAAQPSICLPAYLPKQPKGRTIVIGAGKASAAMAQVLESHWQGSLEGMVVTRFGYEVPCQKIEIIQASHPIPDQAGLSAALRIQALVKNLTADDLVIALISGGGSSLLTLPAEGLTLQDKQSINTALLKSGANISEMNCVRRHLSAIKGGRLAAACHPAKVLTLLISDVPGDSPRDIASGPTVADSSTCADALAIAKRYKIDLPNAAFELLSNGTGESIKSDDKRLIGNQTCIITAPQIALEAAAEVARNAGITPYILSDSMEGEAREIGKAHAGIVKQITHHGQPFIPPCVLISGGETTVTVKGSGRGGRNVEFLLSLAIELDGIQNVYAIAGDTDGVDGAEEIAGAVINPETLERAWALGINPKVCLEANDGHGFFQSLGDSVITGPTLTNVNDFRAIFISA